MNMIHDTYIHRSAQKLQSVVMSAVALLEGGFPCGQYKYTHSYPRGLGKDLGDKCENSWLFRAHFQSISGEEACGRINM